MGLRVTCHPSQRSIRETGVHPHVAVVRNGEGQGALAVHHQIAVPLLQTERAAPHPGAVVHRQQPPGPPRLGQLPLLVQQRDGLCDLMLHQSCLLSAGVPPAFHRAILPSISGKRKGQRGPHIRAAPVGALEKAQVPFSRRGLHGVWDSISCEIVASPAMRSVISEAHVLGNDGFKLNSVACGRRETLRGFTWEGVFDKLQRGPHIRAAPAGLTGTGTGPAVPPPAPAGNNPGPYTVRTSRSAPPGTGSPPPASGPGAHRAPGHRAGPP